MHQFYLTRLICNIITYIIFIIIIIGCFNYVYCRMSSIFLEPLTIINKWKIITVINKFTSSEIRKVTEFYEIMIHASFYKERFFQLSLSVAWLFNELTVKCCLSVAYYIEALSYRNMLYVVYLPLCLCHGLFMCYLCTLFFHYPFHFHYN